MKIEVIKLESDRNLDADPVNLTGYNERNSAKK